MSEVTCINCGHKYTAKTHLNYVLSCAKCIKKFKNEDVDRILDKFFKKL